MTALLDGKGALGDPAEFFGREGDAETSSDLLAGRNPPTDVLRSNFIPTLVNTGEQLVLFDTGRGGDNGDLLRQIEAAGYSADQVDLVVMSHMHPDHIGGLLTGGEPTFPNATYTVGSTEYDFFSNTDLVGSPAERIHNFVTANVAPFVEKARFIAPGESVAPGIEVFKAFGHTPGHLAFHLESEGQRLVLTADTANHFVLALARPDLAFAYDFDAEAASTTRREILGMIAADKVPFLGYHMPFPGIGYLTAQGDGFLYEPMSYQLES